MIQKGGEVLRMRISGLINCVGISIKIYESTSAAAAKPSRLPGLVRRRKFVELIGGHFVTDEMYDFKSGEFKSKGTAFLSKLKEHYGSRTAEQMVIKFHVAASAAVGVEPQSVKEATAMAEILMKHLGLGGTIEKGPSGFTEII
jgi:hypothetical protein